MILISPSILSADFLMLGDELNKVTQAGANLIHIDVMDGHFVPNLTMGPLIVEAVKRGTSLPLDVHLMINNPERSIEYYAKAGADYLTIHSESCIHLERAIKQIKSFGIKAGVALNPSTHESALSYVLDELDLVLVMSVNPGFAHQQFLPSALKKISSIKNMLLKSSNKNCLISVDGGINDQTIAACAKAGAQIFVAGSYIFKALDYEKAITSLKTLAQA
jgi:ribulose-phosphate 3-epimerase